MNVFQSLFAQYQEPIGDGVQEARGYVAEALGHLRTISNRAQATRKVERVTIPFTLNNNERVTLNQSQGMGEKWQLISMCVAVDSGTPYQNNYYAVLRAGGMPVGVTGCGLSGFALTAADAKLEAVIQPGQLLTVGIEHNTQTVPVAGTITIERAVTVKAPNLADDSTQSEPEGMGIAATPSLLPRHSASAPKVY